MSKIASVINRFKVFVGQEPIISVIRNEDEYKAALELLEGVLEQATDTVDDPLNLLIDMISATIDKCQLPALKRAGL